MNIHEYQAKALLRSYGAPVSDGRAVLRAEEAKTAAGELDGPLWVVKAQIHAGGRGKGSFKEADAGEKGGVRLTKSVEEAAEEAKKMLGRTLVTHQTGPEGKGIYRVYVEAAVPIDREIYLGFVLDRSSQRIMIVASAEGGMEIEELAVERPEALAKVAVDPMVGIDADKAREIVDQAGFPEDLKAPVADTIQKLWGVYANEDATLVEVNPLVRTEDGEIIALDGKVTLDENAAFRHADHEALEDKAAADPLEAKAKALDLNYVKLDGAVVIIGNGAGLVMSTLDVVAYAGEAHGGVKPANFLDIGGGASAAVMANGLDVILNDPQVKSVLVNVFGGITSCIEVANGIVGALETLGDAATKPLVVRLDGNSVEEGREILAAANHPLVTIVETMDGAAAKAAELANA